MKFDLKHKQHLMENAHRLTKEQLSAIKEHLTSDEVWVFVTQDAQLVFVNEEKPKGQEILKVGIRPRQVFISDNVIRDVMNENLTTIME